jgi:hypothetical protein
VRPRFEHRFICWLELVKIAPDFTLMQPFGGPANARLRREC